MDQTSEMMMGACYDCRHRGCVAGDAHSKCDHPATKGTREDTSGIGELLGMLKGRGPALDLEAGQALKIRAKAHGITSGWFNFPWNFDPVWLEWCAGFETKDGLNWEQHLASKAEGEPA